MSGSLRAMQGQWAVGKKEAGVVSQIFEIPQISKLDDRRESRRFGKAHRFEARKID